MITLTLSGAGHYARVHHDGERVCMMPVGRRRDLYMWALGYAQAVGEEIHVADTRLQARLEADGLIEAEGA